MATDFRQVLLDAQLLPAIVDALLSEDIDQDTFLSLDGSDLDAIAAKYKPKFEISIGMRKRISALQKKMSAEGSLPSGAPPLRPAAAVPVHHNLAGVVPTAAQHAPSTTPATPRAAPDDTWIEVPGQHGVDEGRLAAQAARADLPRHADPAVGWTDANEDRLADTFVPPSQRTTVMRLEARNAVNAIPLVLPSKVVLANNDPAFATLDETLRASAFVASRTGPKPDTTTYTHPTHPTGGVFTSFVVTNAGRELLHGLGDQPIGVLAAVGSFRKGKSTFLSQVLQWGGREGAQFRVSSKSESCTMGIWAWPELLTAQHDDTMKWLVLDVEGFFAADALNGRTEDKDYYARLFGMTTLLSSVVVYFDHIERAVSSRDLDVFREIGKKIQEFRRGSASLKAAMSDNQRPFAFVVRDWKSTPHKDWTEKSDSSYWESLDGITEFTDFIKLFASEFQFCTLPTFNGQSDPEDLSLAAATTPYRQRFERLMRLLLIPRNATTMLRVEGVEFGGCGLALEAQLDTVADAFSTGGIDISARTLRKSKAEWNILQVYNRAEDRLKEAYDSQLLEAQQRTYLIDVDLLHATLDSIVMSAPFDADDLQQVDPRNPREELRSIVRSLVSKVQGALTLEADRIVDSIHVEHAISLNQPEDFVNVKLLELPAALRDKVGPEVQRRLLDTLNQVESATWAQVEALVHGHVDSEVTDPIDKCAVGTRLLILRRLGDPNSQARQYCNHQKPWLQMKLHLRLEQYRTELVNSLQGHAQHVANSTVERCFAAADLPQGVSRPKVTVRLTLGKDATSIESHVELSFSKKYLPINDLHVAAFKAVECAAIADEVWASVWKAVGQGLLKQIDSRRPPSMRYAYVRVATAAEALRYVAPFDAVETFHVVDAPNDHVVALVFASEDAARNADAIVDVANVELREPVVTFAEFVVDPNRMQDPPTRDQFQRASVNAVVIHATRVDPKTIAVWYIDSNRDHIPCFDAKWIAGARVTFYDPQVLEGDAAVPADATAVVRYRNSVSVYSPGRRSEVKRVERQHIPEYEESWYDDPERFATLNSERGTDFKHRRFSPQRWGTAFATASRMCAADTRWKDPTLCGLRNIVLRGTVAAVTTGHYYVCSDNRHITTVSLPTTKPTFEMIDTTMLPDLPARQTAKSVRVRVVCGDTLDVAYQCVSKPLVLNMANTNTFGGGYANGRAAQEEDLFRRTSYHLLQAEAQNQYPMKPYDVHVATNVAVFRDGERGNYRFFENPNRIFAVDFIGAAAFDLNRHSAPGLLPPTPNNETLTLTTRDGTVTPFWFVATARKIRGILHTAASRGYKVIVLGALGTGAFYNPVDKIIELFQLELQNYCGYFDEIIFAINDPVKAQHFEQGLAGESLRCTAKKPLSAAALLCPHGGLCQMLDDPSHSNDWVHPPACYDCDAAPPVRSDAHRVCRRHRIKCQHWSACQRINDPAHDAAYTHAQRCNDPECRSEDVTHLTDFSHLPLCDQGIDCRLKKDAAHASKYRHVQKRCGYGIKCRAFCDPLHMSTESHPFAPPCPNVYTCNDDREEHLNSMSHICPVGEHCPRLGDPEHVKKYIHLMGHACPDGAGCTRVLDEEHLDTYSHPGINDMRPACRDGPDCSHRHEQAHVKEWAHPERPLAPCVSKAVRGSQIAQGATTAVFHADRRVPFEDNVKDTAAAIRAAWSKAPSESNKDLAAAAQWFDGLLPVHRCAPEVFAAMATLGATVSRDEIEMIADKVTSTVAVKRITRINPILTSLMQKYPNQAEVIQHYAATTVVLAVQGVSPAATPNPTAAAPPSAPPSPAADLKALEKEQSDACAALTQHLPHIDRIKVIAAVENMQTACVALRQKAVGIGYSVDKIVGTDNTVFSIIGPHYGSQYGEVRLVFRREAMHLFDFYMLPCAATYFNRQNYTDFVQRSWAGKDKAPWVPDGKEALLKSKYHPSAPGWSKTLALDIGARGKKIDLSSVKAYYKGNESHNVIEGHLPQSLSLDYVLKALVLEATFNGMDAADQARIRATFGNRLALCKDEDSIRKSVKECFGNPRSMDRPRRGFMTALLADSVTEVPIPVPARKPNCAMHLAFRFRGASMAIVLSNRTAEDQPRELKQYCVFFNGGAVTIADSPAHAMNANTPVLIKRENYFHEDTSTTFMHVCITIKDTCITVSKWGPTEVRNPNGKFVTTTATKAHLDGIKYASIIAVSNVEMLDCEMLPGAPPSVITTTKISAAAQTPVAPSQPVGFFARVANLFSGAPAATPCTAPLGCCDAYMGNADAKQRHHQENGQQKHRCFRGPTCRELNDATHTALFHHDVVSPPCEDGYQCRLRRQPQHRAEYSHPAMWDLMIKCRDGVRCSKRDDEQHQLMYFHPSANDAA